MLHEIQSLIGVDEFIQENPSLKFRLQNSFMHTSSFSRRFLVKIPLLGYFLSLSFNIFINFQIYALRIRFLNGIHAVSVCDTLQVPAIINQKIQSKTFL